MEDEKKTDIWEKYESGRDHHNALNMYENTEQNWNFYNGDQWAGFFRQSKKRHMPTYNIIKPTTNYKTAMIAKTSNAIIYSDMAGEQANAAVTKALTEYAAKQWEKSKMDSVMWDIVKRGAVAGDSYLYWYDNRKPVNSIVQKLQPELKHLLINNTNVYFADEQNLNINEQDWIIISERVSVSKLRKLAKKYGCTQEQINMIVSDEDTDTQVGEDKAQEVKSKLGKCTSLLYMEKTEQGIQFCRSTQQVIYQKMTLIPGLDMYPLIPFQWETKIGSCRGISAVEHMIPNQKSINEALFRLESALKDMAFPKMAYDENAISNPSDLTTVGATIAVKELQQNPVRNVVDFLNPPVINNMASTFIDNMINQTRQLEGAGDAATGQIDPTQASGEAIKTARDQAAIPLNEQMARYKQFIEDIALLWYKMWCVYCEQGMEVQTADGTMNISQDVLKAMDINIKVDVSPIDPYSIMAEDSNLLTMLSNQQITFEEFVNALSPNTNLPKSKLEEMLKLREELNFQEEQLPQEMPQMLPEMGGLNEMPQMPM